jgi:hypothetical protein
LCYSICCWPSTRGLPAAGERALLAFPELTECEIADVNLGSVLQCKYLSALIYHFTHKMFTDRTFALHYVLNLFVVLANLTNGNSYPPEIPVAAATSFAGLTKIVPANFQVFIRVDDDGSGI